MIIFALIVGGAVGGGNAILELFESSTFEMTGTRRQKSTWMKKCMQRHVVPWERSYEPHVIAVAFVVCGLPPNRIPSRVGCFALSVVYAAVP